MTNGMEQTISILLVPGSLRSNSTNRAVLRTIEMLPDTGVQTRFYGGLGDLPHFSPDLEQSSSIPGSVRYLREAMGAADAVLFSTPEYAGSLPGSFKNMLDWLVGEGLYDKPVGWVNASALKGAQGAYQALRTVCTYMNADLVGPACVSLPVRRDQVSQHGEIADPDVRSVLRHAIRALARHVLQKRRRASA